MSVTVGAAVFVLALMGAAPTAQQPAQIRVFDRTVVCKTTGYIRAAGGPGTMAPYDGGALDVNGDPRSGALRSPGQPGSGGLPLAGVIAKNDGLELYRGAFVSTENCSRSANRVPLNGNGLLAPVGFDVTAVCPTGGRVLVRLRYTYVPGVHSRSYQVGGRMAVAQLAVRSYRTLKPLMFAKLAAGGLKLQFANAASCTTST